MTPDPQARETAATPISGAWLDPLLDALATTPVDGPVDPAVRALLARTDWALTGYRCVSGSVWSDVRAAHTEPVVAARAGHCYLARHTHTGAWAALWVPFARLVDGERLAWGSADSKARRDWLADSVIAESVTAQTLTGLLDRHAAVLDAWGRSVSEVYDPTLTACSTILHLDHPEAEAVRFLSALGSWPGWGLRNTDKAQPLLGRVRDAEFAALCGLRRDTLRPLVRQWVAPWCESPAQALTVTNQWCLRLPQGGGFDGLPPVLPVPTEANWATLVAEWCAVQDRPAAAA